MAGKDSIHIGTEADRARYEALTPMRRAEAAQELANEVLDHYDHTRALIAALVTELRNQGTEEIKPALQLATVTEEWLNDLDHLSQESRMCACLQAMVTVADRQSEASHG